MILSRSGSVMAGSCAVWVAVSVPYEVFFNAKPCPLNVTFFEDAVGAIISKVAVEFKSP